MHHSLLYTSTSELEAQPGHHLPFIILSNFSHRVPCIRRERETGWLGGTPGHGLVTEICSLKQSNMHMSATLTAHRALHLSPYKRILPHTLCGHTVASPLLPLTRNTRDSKLHRIPLLCLLYLHTSPASAHTIVSTMAMKNAL